MTSPYQAIPGTYQYTDIQCYAGNGPYNPIGIYKSYLTSGSFEYYSPKCMYQYGSMPKVTQMDVDNAFKFANNQLRLRYPEYGNVTHYNGVDHKEVEGYFLLLVSEYFAKL